MLMMETVTLIEKTTIPDRGRSLLRNAAGSWKSECMNSMKGRKLHNMNQRLLYSRLYLDLSQWLTLKFIFPSCPFNIHRT